MALTNLIKIGPVDKNYPNYDWIVIRKSRQTGKIIDPNLCKPKHRRGIIRECDRLGTIARIILVASVAVGAFALAFLATGAPIIGSSLLLVALGGSYLSYNAVKILGNCGSIFSHGTNDAVKAIAKGTLFSDWLLHPVTGRFFR